MSYIEWLWLSLFVVTRLMSSKKTSPAAIICAIRICITDFHIYLKRASTMPLKLLECPCGVSMFVNRIVNVRYCMIAETSLVGTIRSIYFAFNITFPWRWMSVDRLHDGTDSLTTPSEAERWKSPLRCWSSFMSAYQWKPMDVQQIARKYSL